MSTLRYRRWRLFSIVFVTLVAVATFACSSAATQSAQPGDNETLGALLAAGLATIEGKESPVVVVVTPQTTRAVHDELARIRAVQVDDADRSPGHPLTGGQFRLTSLEIKGRQATLTGVLGPERAAMPGSSLVCGTGYEVHLEQQTDGSWKAIETQITRC